MKNFIIISLLGLVISCNQKEEKNLKDSIVNIRLAQGNIKGNILLNEVPQIGFHVLALVKENIFDGANINVKGEVIIISPDNKVNSKLVKTKVPPETSSLDNTQSVWGLVRSPILEQGDSQLFLCFKSCNDLTAEYIPVGKIIKHDINIDKIQTGQKVLTVLEIQ